MNDMIDDKSDNEEYEKDEHFDPQRQIEITSEVKVSRT
jgi:hypothetical protein